MVAIKLAGFQGEQPRIIPRLLPAEGAQAAVDVRLNDGALTPTKLPLLDGIAGSSTHQTIYFDGVSWLSFPGIVNAAPGPVANDRLYWTGDGLPKVRIAGVTYNLKVPRPTTALTLALGGAGAGDVFTRKYVYTYVTAAGEESEPNDLSAGIAWQAGNTVTLSAFATAAAGRNVTLQRIYRSQTGQSGTSLYFIAERADTAANYVDSIAVDNFAEPIPSIDYNTPPDTLQGLVSLPAGMMAAFVGRDIYFCEPFHPHAWPEKYVQTVDSDIIGLGAAGGTLIVMTKANPYILSGGAPEQMQMAKLEQNLPCINVRSIVDLGFAIAYASNEGLVVAQANGQIQMVSGNLFDRDKWLALSPSTWVCGQHNGRYVAFYNTTNIDGTLLAGAFLIDVGQTPFITRTAARASAVFYRIETGGLYYLGAGEANIYRLDSPLAVRSMLYWRSKEFWMPVPFNYGVIMIETAALADDPANDAALRAATIAANAALIAAGAIGGDLDGSEINLYAINGDMLAELPATGATTQVGVIADGVTVLTITETDVPVRLPAEASFRKWQIDCTTNRQVTQISMGKTMEDLQQVPG